MVGRSQSGRRLGLIPAEAAGPRHNLPTHLTRLVGRTRLLADVQQSLAEARLVTLTGAGGVGKTRLAHAVAASVLDAFADGVWLVELASVADPLLVGDAVARVLGLREEPGQSRRSALVGALRSRELLLVLDNCEHLADECAAFVDELLRASPDLRALVTSRQPLGVVGERVQRVPPLTVPDESALLTAQQIEESEAVQLFCERARSVAPEFRLGERNRQVVAQICRRLDGVALAIELAAARLRVLSVEQIGERLDDRFALLVGGGSTALPQHQTLRGTLDWSHQLLTLPEQLLFRRLAVFVGGWTLEAAEGVCGGDGLPRTEVLDRLAALVDRSLVLADASGDVARYRFLETIRAYARERLAESVDAQTMERQHASYFASLAEQAHSGLSQHGQAEWFARLEHEHDNLRAALRWSLDQQEHETAQRMGRALAHFWTITGYRSEGRRWLHELLALPGTPLAVRSSLLFDAGDMAYLQCDYEPALELFEECLTLRRALGDRHAIARLLDNLGELWRLRGDYARALALLDESVAIGREAQDRYGVALALTRLGRVKRDLGDCRAAVAIQEESLAILHGVDDRHWLAHTLDDLGAALADEGDAARAISLLEESCAIFRELGDREGIASSQGHRARPALRQGEHASATAACVESIALFRELGALWGVPDGVETLAAVTLARGEPERAARLLGAAEALRLTIGVPVPPADRPRCESLLAAARSRLGKAAFAQARQEGRRMPLERALPDEPEVGDDDAPALGGATAHGRAGAPLTARQVEVAALVAEGLTNRQIAERLVIAEGTARIHLEHIFRRLGVTSRAQLAAWAVEHGLASGEFAPT